VDGDGATKVNIAIHRLQAKSVARQKVVARILSRWSSQRRRGARRDRPRLL